MRKAWTAWLILILFVFGASAVRDADHCAACGKILGENSYRGTDGVTEEVLFVCYECHQWPDVCFLCGIPVRKDFLKLPDGRFLCDRDKRTIVTDESEARDLCRQVKSSLDSLLSRFITFPANVDFALVDRVDMYGSVVNTGNNFEFSDVFGCARSEKSEGGMKPSISVLSALSPVQFQATCAHELAHTWVAENVSLARRKAISREAHEGFCELVAFMLMESQGNDIRKRAILHSTYTRGQIELFLEAKEKFGFNDVVDWVRWGVNPKLTKENLGDIRNVEMPAAAKRTASAPIALPAYTATVPVKTPDKLVLKGISGAGAGALAMVNNETLAAGESAKVRVGTSNVLVRCLAIGTSSATIQIVSSGEEMELHLPPAK